MGRPRRTRRLVAVVGVLASITGCAGAGSTPGSPAAPHGTVWLCRPDRLPNPCTTSTAATSVEPDGSEARELTPPAQQKADCFYVYPTVSKEQTPNADLRVQQAERDVATAQASRFSDVCRVWAPIYRQRTVKGLFDLTSLAPNSRANLIAYASVRAAWNDYLRNDNDGRPVILIGHSQGAAMLVRLLHDVVDRTPSQRRLLALAIVLGGNLTVASGQTTGGTTQHIPLCTRPAQAGCIIAYSSFPHRPPAAALFGRPGFGASLLSGETSSAGLEVACVNPADIGGGRAPLHPYVPTAMVRSGVTTPWTSYPGWYTASCRHADGASWLQVDPTSLRTVGPPLVESLGPLWGYHVVDVNVALGDLVADVAASARTWRAAHP